MARLAARQHGVVSRGQLRRLGLSPDQINYLIASATLHAVHRGVYAVGHRNLTRRGTWMAAVLAVGPGAVVSHQSAGIHWRLLSPSPWLPQVTTTSRKRKRPGIRIHKAALPGDEITVSDGIPVTTVARTILDLASCLDAHRLERVIAEAEYRRYADAPGLSELIERHSGRRGLRTLRAVHASGRAELGRTRSPLEERFLRFLDARGYRRPELNASLALGGEFIEVDCLWRRERIALELDGRAAHLRVKRWEADRLRDRRLLAAGWKPARVTDEQLRTGADELDGDLRALGAPARG